MNNRHSSGNRFGNESWNTFEQAQDFFGFGRHCYNKRQEWKEKFRTFFAGKKAVNIIETDDTFTLALYAAGLDKNAFKVSVNNDILTIRYNAPEQTEQPRYAYHEYSPVSFERSFQLNNRALTNNIRATYVDGVLKITLQKNPETNNPDVEISVD